MKNNIYTAIPDWFNKVQSQSTDNTSTTTTQTTIIGGGSSISMSVHNLFIKSDTTITIDDFTISDLFVTDQITDTENWLTTPLLHTLPNTEVSVTTAVQQLYIGAYDKNNNQIKLYQFSEAISTVVIPENCYYLRASSNKTNTDLTIKYVGLNNFDETQQNKLESSSFQNFLTLVEGDEKGIITNSVQNLSLVFQNPLYYTLDKAGNVLISIDRDALFSQSENPTDDRYVTTVADSVQDILSSKNFKEGLSINGIEIVERNGFLYIKGNLATTGGITAYTDDPDDPGSGGGLPGGGAIGDIVITGSGNALVNASLSEDHSVITFTKGWLVDTESDQSIIGIKDFINGLKLDGQLIKIVDGVLFLDCSIAATGGITAYATMPGEGSSSIMDQLVVDTEYFIITEEGVLTIVPGSVGGISNIYVTGNGNALTTVTLSEDGKTVSFTKDKNFADQAEMSAYKAEVNQTIAEFKNEVKEQLKRFVTLNTEQEITAVKHFIEGVTIGSNKHKFYEKDGVLWLEGDIAITGGITTYATENVDVSTIMDGVVVDEITITKSDDNVLRVKNAGAGSSFDENAMWSALASSSDKQINKSHLTTALTGYATETWVIEKGYITSSALNGYATENWVSQNYATLSSLESVLTKLNDFLEGSDTDTIINKWKELEAFLSGMAETDNLAEILETKADKSYVDSTFVTLATKQTITGEKTFSSVLNTAAIKASGAITAPSLAVSDWVTIAGIKLRKLEDGALMLEGNLALTGALTMYASNGQSFDTIYDGLPIDNDTIYWEEVEGSRVLKAREGSGSSFDKSAMWNALAGGTTEQINKTHLTTALNGYATESWVTSKNYLTSVSIATISDLHANWDALLKAAPSAYVTRWPTISEVTGKQNLIVKLNGGTTEGTNQFTYNATGAKTINITPAGIGAAASSHSHNAISASLTGTNALNMVYAQIADNDYFRLRVGGTASNLGYVEFATADDGTEPIYFRQYTGTFTTVKRTLTLLDGSGNSSFPGTVTASTFNGNLAWSHITSKPTTLAGYGITDAPTKTGSGASGTWGIDISGKASNAGKLDGYNETDFFRINRGHVDSTESSLLYRLNGTIVDTSTAGWNGMYAGFCASGSVSALVFRVLGGGQGMNKIYMNYSVDGSSWGDAWRIIATTDSNVNSATKLQTARTLWGRSFDGTGNISGDLTGVGKIKYNNGEYFDEYGNIHLSTSLEKNYWAIFNSNGAELIKVNGIGGIIGSSFRADNWYRSTGNTGWQNETYGGGWYMSDSNFIRSFQNKSVYIGSGSYVNAGGNAYSNNLENISEPNNCRYVSETTYNIPAGYIHPFCGWSDSAAGGWTTSYVIGSIRNYANNWGEMYFGIYQYEGASRAWKAYMVLDGANRHLYIDGNLMVTGGGTFYGSDIRYKSIVQQIKLSLLDIAKAPSFVYRWNKKEMICDRLNIGGSAQYTQTILPWAVEEKNNLFTMDYATVAYTFAVHTARHLLDYETKTDREIRKLKNRIKYLEKQLKSLHYEEANIVDN